LLFVLYPLAAGAAHADNENLLNDVVQCAAGRACIDQVYQNGTTVTVGWRGDQNYGHYNFRWSGPGHPESQQEVSGGDRGSATIPNVVADSGYVVKVQGCNTNLVGQSSCTGWDEQSIKTKPKLAYGADTCRQGFVWRGARPSDHVCVTPQTRDETTQENAAAAARRDPNGGPYGPDTCRQGFVWRDAFPGDNVCVTPESRSRAAADNAAAASRRVAS
jgi:hypothetical protein